MLQCSTADKHSLSWAALPPRQPCHSPPARLQQPLKTLRIGWQKNGVLALAKGQGALEQALRTARHQCRAGRSSPPDRRSSKRSVPVPSTLGRRAMCRRFLRRRRAGILLYAGTYRGSPAGSAILVRKDSPIQSIADLKGKRVAFKRGSSAHNFTVKALRSAGLAVTDVTASDLSPSDAAAAFTAGQIDAWAIWDPYLCRGREAAGNAGAGDCRRVSSNPGRFSSAMATSPRRMAMCWRKSSMNWPSLAGARRIISTRRSGPFRRSPACRRTSRELS